MQCWPSHWLFEYGPNPAQHLHANSPSDLRFDRFDPADSPLCGLDPTQQ
jgi:hypothetical protein